MFVQRGGGEVTKKVYISEWIVIKGVYVEFSRARSDDLSPGETSSSLGRSDSAARRRQLMLRN